MNEFFSFISFGCMIILTPFIHSFEIDEKIHNVVAEASVALFPPSTSISAFLCAKTGKLVDFSRGISKRNVFINYLKFHDFEEHISRISPHRVSILLDIDCPQAMTVLNKANNLEIFGEPLKWLLLQNSSNSSTSHSSNECLSHNFRNFTMYLDSDVIVLRKISDDQFQILSIYRPSSDHNCIIENLGFWSSSDGIVLYNTDVASKRRRNVQRSVLTSAIVLTDPDSVNHLTDYQDKHIDTGAKATYIWINQLSQAINAKISYTIVNSWGYRDSNGSWNGMMGLLNRKEIDIGGTVTFIVQERLKFVDYIPIYFPTKFSFVFRDPPLSLVSNLLTLPFGRSVWIAIGVLIILIVSLLVTSSKWEWNIHDINFTPELKLTFSDNFLLVVGAFAQQGFGFNPRLISSRIILFMLLMISLNLYAAYSAHIVALLSSTTSSIKNLDDILRSPLKCGAADFVYNHHYFKIEKDPIRRAIIDQKIEPKGGKSNWMSSEEGANRIRQGSFAFFDQAGVIYKLVQEIFEEDEKCGFHEIPFMTYGIPHVAVVKRSPYLEILRVAALKVGETGLRSKEMRSFYTARPACNGRRKFVSAGLRECYFAFYLISYGILFSIILVFAETAWMRCCK